MKSERAMEIVQLAVILADLADTDKSQQDVSNDAWLIASYASRLHRYAEVDCNSGLTLKQDQAAKRDKARVFDIAKTYGILGVEFNGDPRGYAVYLKLPNGRTNDWGQRGWGI